MSSNATLLAIDEQQPSFHPVWLYPARRRWSAVLLLPALCGFLFFYGLNAIPFVK